MKNKLDESLKLIAKTSFVVLIGIIISKLSLYIYRVIIARYYGPEVYGLFSLALMILNLFVAISALGLSEGILRYVPLYRSKSDFSKIKKLFKITNYISLFSSIFFAVILFFSAKFISVNIFHNQDLTIFIKIAGLILPFYVLSGLYLSLIRAFEMINLYSFLINIFQNVLKVVALGIFIWLGLNSSWIMVSFFIGILLMFIFVYYFCKTKIKEIFKLRKESKERNENEFLKPLFFYSLPLMFSGVFSIVYYWIDSFAIGYLKQVIDVGFYNAVVPIALLITIIPDLFIQLFYPLITKEYAKKNFKLIEELSKQVVKWIFVISLPLFLLIILFPGVVINFLFGPDYLIAEHALQILSAGAFISILTGILTTLLSMVGKSKTIFLNLVLTSILNIVLNFLLIPKYGITGAALATSIVWVALIIILFIEVKLTLSFIPLRRKLIRVALISIIPLAILMIIRSFIKITLLSSFLSGVLIILIYFILIFITGCLDKNDWMIIKSFKNKLSSIKIS